MNFKLWLESKYIRINHKDGRGLMNNQSLNYDKLNDDEYSDVEDAYHALQQPPRDLHGKNVVFVFTPEGMERHKQLIKLLKKASKTGTVEKTIDPEQYVIVWESGDGQVAMLPKE